MISYTGRDLGMWRGAPHPTRFKDAIVMGKSKAAKQAKKAVQNVVKKEVKQAAKAEAKIIRQEVKKIEAPKQILAAAKAHAPHEYQKMKKDPVFQKYFATLVYPDREDYSGVPDGYPVPTALLKTTQTIDVIANYNATSITNGDGGRFFFHIAPNAGIGQIESDGYVQIAQDYTNISSDDTAVETLHNIVLSTKVASLRPSVPWAPGNMYTAALDSEKKSEKKEKRKVKSLTPKPDSEAIADEETTKTLKQLRLDARLRNGGRIKGHRLESDFISAAYEYWSDPEASTMAGAPVSNGVYGVNDINGLATQIRPVAMTVWFQCTKAALDNAGSVSAGLLPAGTTFGQIAPVDWPLGVNADGWTGYGPLQNWENLAEVPGTYNGKLMDGCYVWWVPQRVSDLQMNPLGLSDIEDYPTIVVSGQWSPNGGEVVNAASSLIGRLRIVTVYEYTSQRQTAEQHYRGCTIAPLDRVKTLLHGQPTAMPNATHLAWVKKILSMAAGAVVGFASGGPAGAFAGAEMGYAAGKKWAGD